MESEVLDRRMIREATLGLLVLTALFGVLFVTIYLKARVLWTTSDEDFLSTPVTVYQLGQGNILTPTKKPPLVPLPAIESNQMVDLGEMRTIPAERFADLHSNGNRPAGTRLAALEIGSGEIGSGEIGSGTGNFPVSPGTGNFPVSPGTGNFPASPEDEGQGTGEGTGTGKIQEFPDVAPGSTGVEPFDPNGTPDLNSPTKTTRSGLPRLPELPEVLQLPDRDSSDFRSPELPTLAAQSRVPPVPGSVLGSARDQERGLPPVPESSESTPVSGPGLPPIDPPDFRVPQSSENSIVHPVRHRHSVNVHAELDQVSPEYGLPDPERNLSGSGTPKKGQPESPVPPHFSIDDLKNSLRRVGLPPEMSMQQLSERLYGNSRYAVALMQLNHRRASSDGHFIPGTQIHYLPAEMLAFVYPDLVEAGFTLEQNREPRPEQPDETSHVQPVAYQEVANENVANALPQNHEPQAEWYLTQGGETVFEIAADHLDQASHYVELMQWNRSLLVGRYRPTDPLPKGLRLRLRP